MLGPVRAVTKKLSWTPDSNVTRSRCPVARSSMVGDGLSAPTERTQPVPGSAQRIDSEIRPVEKRMARGSARMGPALERASESGRSMIDDSRSDCIKRIAPARPTDHCRTAGKPYHYLGVHS